MIILLWLSCWVVGRSDARQLKFSHITKTAGSAIEVAAKKRHVLWGLYDPLMNQTVGRWHQPIMYLPRNIRQNYDWFIVVRNPFTRLISEFYWYPHCIIGGRTERQNNLCNILKYQNILYEKPAHENLLYIQPQNMTAPLLNVLTYIHIKNRGINTGYHYLEQHLYIDNACDCNFHVLKYENVTQDFNNLARRYNLDVELTPPMAKRGHSNPRLLCMRDFDDKTRRFIVQTYIDDFKRFNYSY